MFCVKYAVKISYFILYAANLNKFYGIVIVVRIATTKSIDNQKIMIGQVPIQDKSGLYLFYKN